MDFLDLIIPRYTTPLPSFARNLLITSEGMDFMMTSGRTQIRAVIRPDRFDFPPYFDPGSDAETGCEIDTDVYHNVTFDSRSRVLNFDRREFVVHIRTRYKITIDPEIQSSYGRGTTRRDRQAGNTTLRFHESQHGVMCLNYIHRNQIPDLVIRRGMPQGDIAGIVADFGLRINRYVSQMETYHINAVDCSGRAASFCRAH